MTASNLRILAIGQHKLAVKAFNEDQTNTPLIFIHGITSSVNFWVGEQTPLIKQQRWYSLSLLGHYPSQFPNQFEPEALNAELIADITAQAIQQLVGDQPVILVGHSTGGLTALAVASKYPELVKSVISVSGFPHGYWTGVLRLLQIQARMGALGKLLFKLNLRVLPSAFQIYRYSLRFYAGDVRALYAYPNFDDVIRVSFEDAGQLDLDAMYAFFNRMPDIDITAWLENIQAPTLVIAGNKDPVVSPEQAKVIAERVPNSTLRMIEGVGHLPMLERPDHYHEIVMDWFTRYL